MNSEYVVNGPLVGRILDGYTDPVRCKVCNATMAPDPRGNVFLAEDPWWVCDTCAAQHAPTAFSQLERLRALCRSGVSLRQVDARELLDGITPDTCPLCGLETLDFVLEHQGWMVVAGPSLAPVCEDHARTAGEPIVALQAELNAASGVFGE